MLTVAYSLRFLAGATGRLADPDVAATTAAASAGPPALAFVAPALVLTAVTVVLGVVPGLADHARHRRRAGARRDDRARPTSRCGTASTSSCVLSAVALTGGVAAVRRPPPRRQRSSPTDRSCRRRRAPTSSTLRGVNAVANRVTAVAQPGSLPIYLGVILLTAALVPGVLLAVGDVVAGLAGRSSRSRSTSPIAALLIGLALAAAIVRRRFAGALFLGMVGYSMAALFVAQGAPDLALTQVAIETLSTVLFVLVLRRLPDRFETTPRRRPPHRAHRHRRRSSACSCSCSRSPSAACSPTPTSPTR